METVIKVTPAELNASLLDKIKAFIGNGKFLRLKTGYMPY